VRLPDYIGIWRKLPVMLVFLEFINMTTRRIVEATYSIHRFLEFINMTTRRIVEATYSIHSDDTGDEPIRYAKSVTPQSANAKSVTADSISAESFTAESVTPQPVAVESVKAQSVTPALTDRESLQDMEVRQQTVYMHALFHHTLQGCITICIS